MNQQLEEIRKTPPAQTDPQFNDTVELLNRHVAQSTEPETAVLAATILGELGVPVTVQMNDKQLETVSRRLYEQLRDLFTSSGAKDRKERFKNVAGFSLSTEDEAKYSKASTGALIQLIHLSGASKQLAQTYISFIFPAVLNLCDYHEPSVKITGAQCVLALCNPDGSYRALVRQMRLAQVFWDALQPHLSFLPPSTEETVAAPLQQVTYEALTPLYLMMRQGTPAEPTLKDLTLLDELLQQVVRGLDLSYIRTVKTLLHALDGIVDLFGKYAASYVEELVVAWTPIMEDPFATADLSLLETCGNTILHFLKTVSVATVKRHALEVARITAIALANVRKEEKGKRESAESVMMDVFDKLVAVRPDIVAIRDFS
ncbi:hypothetical protein B0I71DRAFT_135443 [Yarrowia lipolytica]|uniref:Uncharacterized protein n=1 Tax=Yarrowia lipolytica TaxID=4952 RepID=A0A371C089_YARLL|nr:hypothetical protein B0I71DRAFT_135443 [Yarrowia lipolytica]